MKNRVCRLNFHTFGKLLLDTFANGVKVGVYENPHVFVSVSLTKDEFTTILTSYTTANADYDTYGKTKKTVYDNAKKDLMIALDKLSVDVNKAAINDPSIIILGGFNPTSDQFQRVAVPDKIETITIKQTVVNGQIIVETAAIRKKGITGYGLICLSGSKLPNNSFSNGILNFAASSDQQIIIDFNKARKKIIDGLIPGVQYFIYMFAVNSSGVSPLSDARSNWAS